MYMKPKCKAKLTFPSTVLVPHLLLTTSVYWLVQDVTPAALYIAGEDSEQAAKCILL